MRFDIQRRDLFWLGLLAVALMAARAAAPATKWEYQFLTNSHLDRTECVIAGIGSELCGRSNMTANANSLGEDGWELAGCFLQPAQSGRKVTCYLKRPLP